MSPGTRRYLDQLVAAAPPLSPEQRVRLAILLRPDLPVGIRENDTAKPAQRAT